MLLMAGCGGSAPLPSPTVESQSVLGPTTTLIVPTSTSPPVQSPAPEAAQAPEESESVLLELLGTIPDTPETREIVLINDHARVRELFNIQLPGPDADKDELEQYRLALGSRAVVPRMASESFISGFNEYRFHQLDRRRYLAFDMREVDQTVETGMSPTRLEVIVGHFDPDAADRALKSCDECPTPDRQEWQGIPYYSWGEGKLELRFSPPAFDQLGRGGRIAVLNNYVFRTLETPGMKALIDTSRGNQPSLADSEEFRLLAQGMSTLEAYSILMSDMTPDLEEVVARLLASLRLKQTVPNYTWSWINPRCCGPTRLLPPARERMMRGHTWPSS